MKFKVGDKVYCINSQGNSELKYGDIYTVAISNTDSIEILKSPSKFSLDRFELATLYDRVIADRPSKDDVVNQPAHYTTGGIEVVDFIEAKNLNFRIANVVKYVVRAKHKGKELEDLKKAAWYLQREISKLEKV